MADPIRITEGDLRVAMRDTRYRNGWHPEREGFSNWVSGGWRALHPRDAQSRSSVWVRAYTRNGHKVSAHFRGTPARGSSGDGGNGGDGGVRRDAAGSADAAGGNVQDVQFGPLLRQLFRAPAGRGGGGAGDVRPPPTPRPLRPGPDGRDRAAELRSSPETKHSGELQRGVQQWDRPVGPEQRNADLQRLNPVGEPKVNSDSSVTYQLQDGRIATLRRSNGSGRPLTLELAEPGSKPGRFDPTDKFRYGATE